jgi:antitoxin component HigA of HigAB toxin-antitoxin module
MAATMTLDFSTPHVLRTVKEYNAAVAEVDRLLDENPKRGTTKHDRLNFSRC